MIAVSKFACCARICFFRTHSWKYIKYFATVGGRRGHMCVGEGTLLMTCLCKPHKGRNISSSPRHYNKERLACGELDLTISKTERKIAPTKLFSWVRVPELRVFESFPQMAEVYYPKNKTKQNTAEGTKRRMLETTPTTDNSSLDFQRSFHWETSIQRCSVGRHSNPASPGTFSEMVPVRKCQDMVCHWKRAWSWGCRVIIRSRDLLI